MAKLAETLDKPLVKTDAQKRRRLEELLDMGLGSCVLGKPQAAAVVEENLLHFDGSRYRLDAWVVMPNHVHVLIEVSFRYTLSEIVHGWKSFTSKRINKLLGLTGSLWQREYFDRALRNEQHWLAAVDYIHQNPVKAGLVERADDWQFGSSRRWTRLGVGE